MANGRTRERSYVVRAAPVGLRFILRPTHKRPTSERATDGSSLMQLAVSFYQLDRDHQTIQSVMPLGYTEIDVWWFLLALKTPHFIWAR